MLDIVGLKIRMSCKWKHNGNHADIIGSIYNQMDPKGTRWCPQSIHVCWFTNPMYHKL